MTTFGEALKEAERSVADAAHAARRLVLMLQFGTVGMACFAAGVWTGVALS